MTYWFGCWGCAHCRKQKCQMIIFVNEKGGKSITASLWLVFCSGGRADSHRAAAPCTVGVTHTSEQAGNFFDKSGGDSCQHVAHSPPSNRPAHFWASSYIWILYQNFTGKRKLYFVFELSTTARLLSARFLSSFILTRNLQTSVQSASSITSKVLAVHGEKKGCDLQNPREELRQTSATE